DQQRNLRRPGHGLSGPRTFPGIIAGDAFPPRPVCAFPKSFCAISSVGPAGAGYARKQMKPWASSSRMKGTAMNVLVVGGAGSIGSHCVRQLARAGHRPVVLDNLVFGHRAAVAPEVSFYHAELGDEEAVGRVLAAEKVEVVMHFAAFAYVGESVNDPLKYYINNVAATLHLLRAMLRQGVNKFVFSSTCATYGVPATLPIVETSPQQPINPYGQT